MSSVTPDDITFLSFLGGQPGGGSTHIGGGALKAELRLTVIQERVKQKLPTRRESAHTSLAPLERDLRKKWITKTSFYQNKLTQHLLTERYGLRRRGADSYS